MEKKYGRRGYFLHSSSLKSLVTYLDTMRAPSGSPITFSIVSNGSTAG